MKLTLNYNFADGKSYPQRLTFAQISDVFGAAQSPIMAEMITNAKDLLKQANNIQLPTNGAGFNLSIPDWLVESLSISWQGPTAAQGALTVNGVQYSGTGTATETLINLGEGVNSLQIRAYAPITITSLRLDLTNETSENLQRFGTNTDAKNIVNEYVLQFFPALSDDLTDEIIETFYRWGFPYDYALRSAKWRLSVKAWCKANKKLSELDSLYALSLGEEEDGHFWESWTGADTKSTDRKPVQVTQDFTDNLARENVTQYSGVGVTSTATTADRVTQSPINGQNTQKNVSKTEYQGVDTETTQKGTSRKYSDGRTIKERIADIMSVSNPIQVFVGGFAQFLKEPCECEG